MKKTLLFFLIGSLFFVSIFLLITRNRSNVKLKKNKILLSCYPVFCATRKILEDIDDFDFENLSTSYFSKNPAQCMHDFYLTANDFRLLEDSSCFVISGANFEPFLSVIKNKYPKLKIIDSSKNIDFIVDNENEVNPYIWTSLSNYIVQIKNISDGLCDIFPEHKEKIKRNTELYIKDIENKNKLWISKFAKFEGSNILVTSDKFDYLFKDLNLCPIHIVDRHIHESSISSKDIEDAVNKINYGNYKFYVDCGDNLNILHAMTLKSGINVINLSLFLHGGLWYEFLNEIESNLKVLYNTMNL